MDYIDLVSTTCPASIAMEIQSIGSDMAAGDRLWDLTLSLEGACGSNALGFLADRVNSTSDTLLLSAYFSEATRLVASNTAQIRQRIGEAASRVDIENRPDLARSYFTGLMVNKIDIRNSLAQRKISELHGGDFRSTPWQYHLYLAALNTPGSIEIMQAHLATVASGNDATNLIRSLANLRKPKVRDVISQYQDDLRHADGPSGPGATISETVSILLESYRWDG